jgi:hypothetical protein
MASSIRLLVPNKSGGRELPSGHIRKSKISKSIPTLSLFIFCDIRTTAMAPPIINIEFMKDQIQQWYLTDCETIDTIIDRVFIEINTTISTRTMKRKLQTWGFQRRNNIVETTQLRLSIAILFQQSYADNYIVRQLGKEGHIVSERQVARIRKKMGCVRRMTVWQRAQADEQLQELVRQELDNGLIEGYGKELLQKWFRKKGYITTRYVVRYNNFSTV